MAKKRVVKTKKQENKDALAKLFPKSVETMDQILNDNLKTRNGAKVKVTGKMRQDVATLIVSHVVGRAPQSLTSNAGDDVPPVTMLEVIKTYADTTNVTDNSDPPEQKPVPAEEFEQKKEPDRDDWLRQVEAEALMVLESPETG